MSEFFREFFLNMTMFSFDPRWRVTPFEPRLRPVAGLRNWLEKVEGERDMSNWKRFPSERTDLASLDERSSFVLERKDSISALSLSKLPVISCVWRLSNSLFKMDCEFAASSLLLTFLEKSSDLGSETCGAGSSLFTEMNSLCLRFLSANSSLFVFFSSLEAGFFSGESFFMRKVSSGVLLSYLWMRTWSALRLESNWGFKLESRISRVSWSIFIKFSSSSVSFSMNI